MQTLLSKESCAAAAATLLCNSRKGRNSSSSNRKQTRERLIGTTRVEATNLPDVGTEEGLGNKGVNQITTGT